MGLNCSKCYAADLEVQTGSPKAERLTFNHTNTENLLISQLISPNNKQKTQNANLFQSLDEVNINSYFMEAQAFLTNQHIGVKQNLISTNVDATFPKIQKVWLKIDKQPRYDNSYTIYAYSHLPFSPDLYALSQISFAISKQTVYNQCFSHEVIDSFLHQDTFVSVWRSTYLFVAVNEPVTFIYVRILKQLDNDEYFECFKDIKFTSLAGEEPYQSLRERTQRLGTYHTGGSRYYVSKGRYYCQTYQELDFLSKSSDERAANRVKLIAQSELFDMNMQALQLIIGEGAQDSRIQTSALSFFDPKLTKKVITTNRKCLAEIPKKEPELKLMSEEFEKARSKQVRLLAQPPIIDQNLTVSTAIETQNNQNTTRKLNFDTNSNIFIDNSEVRNIKNQQMKAQLLSNVIVPTVKSEQNGNKKEAQTKEEFSDPTFRFRSQIGDKGSSKNIFTKNSPPTFYDVIGESPRTTFTTPNGQKSDFDKALEQMKGQH